MTARRNIKMKGRTPGPFPIVDLASHVVASEESRNAPLVGSILLARILGREVCKRWVLFGHGYLVDLRAICHRRMLPSSFVNPVIGRAFAVRADAEQRAERIEGVEPAIEAERELVE